MLIYRIAHPEVIDSKTGFPVGPYNALNVAQANDLDNDDLLDELHDMNDALHKNTPYTCPAPAVEGHRMREGRDQSAFASHEQAKAWFTFGVTEMKQVGFQWFTYKVPDVQVRITPTQAIAVLRGAELISVEDIPLPDTEPMRYEGRCWLCENWLSECECVSDECQECWNFTWDCSC